MQTETKAEKYEEAVKSFTGRARDEGSEHYKALNDIDECFVGFSERLLQKKDADTLRTLIEVHRAVMPNDENIADYEKALGELK